MESKPVNTQLVKHIEPFAIRETENGEHIITMGNHTIQNGFATQAEAEKHIKSLGSFTKITSWISIIITIVKTVLDQINNDKASNQESANIQTTEKSDS